MHYGYTQGYGRSNSSPVQGFSDLGAGLFPKAHYAKKGNHLRFTFGKIVTDVLDISVTEIGDSTTAPGYPQLKLTGCGKAVIFHPFDIGGKGECGWLASKAWLYQGVPIDSKWTFTNSNDEVTTLDLIQTEKPPFFRATTPSPIGDNIF